MKMYQKRATKTHQPRKKTKKKKHVFNVGIPEIVDERKKKKKNIPIKLL